MTVKKLMEYIASQLPQHGSEMNWIIRGEVGTEEVDENKNLIAVTNCIAQSEIIFANFTYKLDCQLVGQILLNALTGEQLDNEVSALYEALSNYVKSLHYTDCNGPIVLQGVCNNIETSTDELYYNFTVPFTLYVQF